MPLVALIRDGRPDEAHRAANSPYRKRTETEHGTTEGRGVITTQFIRDRSGWRIASMAWDDERPGLELAEPV